MTNTVARFAFATVVAIAFVAWILTLAMTGASAASAIGLSAVVAAVVQIAAFTVTRSMAERNIVAAWGAGALVRMLTLFVYGFLAVKILNLPPVPALISLVVFFFLSTLIEPVFLRR